MCIIFLGCLSLVFSLGIVLTVSFSFQAPAQQIPPGYAVYGVGDGDGGDAEIDDRASGPASPPEHEPVLPEEALPPSVTTKKNKVVLDLHTRLSSHFPDLFHHDEVQVPYYEEQPPAASLLILNPDLSRSWLQPPAGPADSYGFWNPSGECKLPPNRSHLFPPGAKGKPLARAPYFHVEDDALRRKFKAPTLGSVSLDLQVFDKGEVSVGSSPLVLMEAHSRAALLECYTADAYIKILHELTKCAVGSSDIVPQAEALELLPEVVRQSAMANARCGQSLAAGYVGNVVALRDVVLDRFTTEPRTTNILRAGDFSGPSLFGPLPESIASLLDTPQGAKHRCCSKAPGHSSFRLFAPLPGQDSEDPCSSASLLLQTLPGSESLTLLRAPGPSLLVLFL